MPSVTAARVAAGAVKCARPEKQWLLLRRRLKGLAVGVVAPAFDPVRFDVGDFFEPAEAEEAAGAFSGVHTPEHPANQFGVGSAPFEFNEIEVELVETFVALDGDFVNALVALC